MSKNTIRIRRAKHDSENPYYLASRATAQDRRLSYEALGLLNYVLSKPDDWEIQPPDLERDNCKRNRVYKLLGELIDLQYMERVYHRNKRGQVEHVEYIAHETPLSKSPLPEKQEVVTQEVALQEVETPHLVSPNVGKPHITYKREEQNTEENIEDSASDDASASQRSSLDEKFTDEANTSRPPSSETPSAAPPDGKAVAALIKAWLDASGTIAPNSYSNKTIRAQADEMVKRGIQPEHVTAFIKALRQEKFWSAKEIKWSKVAGEIVPWLNKNQPPTPKPAATTPDADAGLRPLTPAELKAKQRENVPA